jgi:hypothetical protein
LRQYLPKNTSLGATFGSNKSYLFFFPFLPEEEEKIKPIKVVVGFQRTMTRRRKLDNIFFMIKFKTAGGEMYLKVEWLLGGPLLLMREQLGSLSSSNINAQRHWMA